MPLPIGATLNARYTIQRCLSENALATVYLAERSGAEDASAAGGEVLLTEYFPTALAERTGGGDRGAVQPRDGREELFRQGVQLFRKEARALREIDHANIASEEEDFQAQGTAFRVGAHPAGASLAQALENKGGRITEAAAQVVIGPALEALHAVHRAGLIHAGLSPAAIYLTEERKVLLRGFRGAQLQLARTMVQRGVDGAEEALADVSAPGLSAPEQRSASGRHGPWTDVFAAAATFFRAITGKRLPGEASLPNEQAASAAKEKQAGLAEALAGAEGLSEERRPVLARALASRPRGRLQSAKALAELLDNPSTLPDLEEKQEETPEDPGEEQETEAGIAATAAAAAREDGGGDEDERGKPAGEEADALGGGGMEKEAWGPASIAAAAAEAARKEKEKARSRRQARGDDAPRRRGGRSGEEGEEKPKAERERRMLPVSGRVAMGGGAVVLMIGAVLLMSGLLGGSESSAESSADAQYERLVAAGDSLFKASSYEAAAKRYREAENLDLEHAPDAERISERLVMIDRLREAVSAENYRRALSRGDSLTAQAERMAGDDEFGAQARLLLEQAREAYVTALSSRPDDSTALERVQRVRTTLNAGRGGEEDAQENGEEDEDGETTLEEERRRLFERYRDRGDEAFANENYGEARSRFNSALEYRPDNAYVRNKLEEIETRLSEAQQQEQYRRYRRRADSLFEAGRLEAAQNQYQLALDATPNDPAVQARLDTIAERRAQRRRRQEQYQIHRSRGDLRFDEGDFQQAVASYRKALEQRPDDDYAQRRVEEAQQRLAAAEAEQQQQAAGEQRPSQQTAPQQTAAQQQDDDAARPQQTAPRGESEEDAGESEPRIHKNPDQKPKIVGGKSAFYEKVSYPERAREQGVEGRVYLRVTVGADGSLQNIETLMGIGHGADEEAINAARNTTFEPATVEGEPVRAYRTLMVQYEIDT